MKLHLSSLKAPTGWRLPAASACALLLALSSPPVTNAHHANEAEHAVLVTWSADAVTVTTEGGSRVIRSSGLPDHKTGDFPNSGNPHTISSQSYVFRAPIEPVKTAATTPGRGYWFGVALNGVPFEPGTAEFWQGDRNWNYEALSGFINLGLDQNNAHVQPTGAYHYHGIPSPLVSEDWSLVGYAADGHPIYVSKSQTYTSSYVLKQGKRQDHGTPAPSGSFDGTFTADYEYTPGAGNLDECNGVTVDGEYVYVLTDAFPHVPRCFKGTPDDSFRKARGGPRGGHRGHRPHGHPPPF